MHFSVHLLQCADELLVTICVLKYTYVVHSSGYIHDADWLQYLHESGHTN